MYTHTLTHCVYMSKERGGRSQGHRERERRKQAQMIETTSGAECSICCNTPEFDQNKEMDKTQQRGEERGEERARQE